MMSRKRNMGLVERLAVARASGITVREFATQNKIPLSTCFHWAQTPAFREAVLKHREALAAATISRVADHVARRMIAEPIPA
jgi:hypothetical protein